MSNPSNQVSQYKDALKLMKKKYQSAESQYNGTAPRSRVYLVEIKSKYDTLHTSILSFLQYVAKPFDGWIFSYYFM